MLLVLGLLPGLVTAQTTRTTRTSRQSAASGTVPTGTLLTLRLNKDLDSKTATQGQAFTADVTQGVRDAQGRVVIPVGSTVEGTVSQVQKAGTVSGQSRLQLRFRNVLLPNGTRVPLVATLQSFDTGGGGVGGAITGGPGKTTSEGGVERSKTRSTVGTTAAGGGVGAILGGLMGGGKGAGIGAVVGAGAGAIMGSRGGDVHLKQGTQMTVRLDRALTIRP
jgi:hypothetical protein